jgi:16S rRNA (uracil1498-N3)-methyltransferase
VSVKSARRIRYRGRLFPGPVFLDEFSSHKIVSVLRLGPGAVISVVDDDGAEAACRITAIDQRGVLVEPVLASSAEPARELIPVTIAIALIRNERMDEAIEKVAEFGVAAIQPFVAEHSSRRLVTADRIERWRRIATTAALQSGGRKETAILAVGGGVEELLAATGEAATWHLHQAGRPVREILAAPIEKPRMILVGPEGGWSEKELAIFADRSSMSIALGERILRTETAAALAAFLAIQC